MTEYKAKKGGDPSRRPAKVSVDYACPGCGNQISDIVDEGKPGRRLCPECRDMKNAFDAEFDENSGFFCTGFGGRPAPVYTCVACGNTKGEMNCAPDPHEVKTKQDYIWVWMHPHCRAASGRKA